MSKHFIGLIAVLAAASTAVAATNVIARSQDASTNSAATDPVEREYKQLMADDDAAQAQVDDWITENKAFAAKGAGASDADLNRRILERFAPIKQGYEDFIKRHPDHANARVAFGSFLNDLHDEEGAEAQWEKGRELDPKNPAAWNNLAGVYGEGGKVKKAFEYYAKAIELNPLEPLYYHNFGTTVYLFRKDAREFYNLTEQQVFDKALELYSKALKLDPDNFPLASDVAQTYYGIKPLRAEEALRAWTNTLAIAHDDIEREGVYLHLARIKLAAGRFDEARQHVNSVTNEAYADLKQRLTHNLNEQEKEAKEGKGANAPGVISVPKAEGAQAPTSKLQAPEKSQAPAAKP